MKKKIHIISAVAFVAFMLCFSAPKVFAADPINISFGIGFPIQVNNLAPGDVVKRTFSVENRTKDSQILMLRFDRTSRAGILERRIQVKIRRVSDGKFLRFPLESGSTSRSLSWLYHNILTDPILGKSFAFDILPGKLGAKESYELWFTFDPQAGNRFQNQKTVFNLSASVFPKSNPNEMPKHNWIDDFFDKSKSFPFFGFFNFFRH